MSKFEVSSELAAEINVLRARYIASLPAKRQEIEACWSGLDYVQLDRTEAGDLLKMVHKLAGSAGMFELPQLCELAKSTESILTLILEETATDSDWGRYRIKAGDLIRQLIQELDQYHP